jgi:hypothetical protein
MNANRFSILLACLLAFAFQSGDGACAANSSNEKYRYEALPLEDGNGQKEIVNMEISRSKSNLRYRTKYVSIVGLEEIEIETEPAGHVVSATRSFVPADKKSPPVEKIWRQGEKAYYKSGAEGEAWTYHIPVEKYFAVDGSLLILLRAFPFGSNEAWSIYMVDFSGLSTTVTLRHMGMESVTVPAGTFDCYKMEVTVEIPILRPRIIYWVAKKKPHFLVKSIGKRGAFSRADVTSLLSIELEID